MFPPATARIAFYEMLLAAMDASACAAHGVFRLVYGDVASATPAQVEVYLAARRVGLATVPAPVAAVH